MGREEAARTAKGAAHPVTHRTETVNSGIVLPGELALAPERGETVVRAGEIVIQGGTNHAWADWSGRNCRMAFLLIC